MGLLDGQIRNAIAAGFKGKLLKGTLTRATPGGGLDKFGDPVSVSLTTFRIEGFEEARSAEYKTRMGVPDTDTVILLIAGLINPPTVPTKDDTITFRGKTWQVRKLVATDPAEATYTVAGYGS